MRAGRDALRRRNRILSWVIIVACTALAAAGGALLPFAHPLDVLVLDRWFAARGAESPAPEVMVIAVDGASLRRMGPWPLRPEVHARLLNALAGSNPAVVVTLVPTQPSFRAEHPDVVFRAGLEPDPYRPDEIALDPAEAEVVGARGGHPVGIAAIRPEGGIVRRARLLHPTAQGAVPSIELAAAMRLWGVSRADLGGDDDALRVRERDVPLEAGAMRIRWAGPSRSYPYVSAFRILGGEIEPQDLAGKVLLVGATDPEVAPGYATPPGGRLPTPGVEVHAHALGTLLSGRFVRPLPSGLLLIGLLAVGLGLGLIMRRFPPLVAFAIFVAVAVLAPIVSFAAFAVGSVFLPVTPPVFLALLLFVGLGLHTAHSLDREMNDLVEEFTRLDRGFYAAPEDADERSWDRALDLASLFIDAESFILFKKPPDKWHLELVGALRATDGEVAERRRDIRRTPWSDAINVREPIVRNRLMEGDRASLIVPLMSLGPLSGFLVINQPAGGEGLFLERKSMIRFVAEQLATLLNRELLHERLRRRNRGLLGVLSVDRARDRLDALATVTNALLEKKVLLFSVLNAADQGVIICDIFGRVVLYNSKIAQIGEVLGRRIEGKNVLDLLREIADLEPGEVVRRMGELIVHDRRIRFEVTSKGQHGYHYRLELSAVRKSMLTGEIDASQPVLGIVCVFTDVTELKELDLMKTHFVDMISSRVLNLLASIQGYSEILLESGALRDESRSFAEIIKRQSETLGTTFQDFSSALRLGQESVGVKRLPLNVANVLEAVIERRGPEIEKKAIVLDRRLSATDAVILADRRMIERSLDQVVGLMLENCLRGSELLVVLEREAGSAFVRVSVASTGSGLPKERLATLFERASDAASGPSSGEKTGGGDLSEVHDAIDLHGGDVEAKGKLGEGLAITLRLPVFMQLEGEGAGEGAGAGAVGGRR